MIERYYNRFAPNKKWAELLFRAGDGLQSAELNELQSVLKHRLRLVADAVLQDGDIITGGGMTIDPNTGATYLEASHIYLAGAVHVVPEATFTLPVTGHVTIGVRLTARAVTEVDDASLRDPAVGTRNYQEPGAGRLVEEVAWGWVGDNAHDGGTGEFYPIATVIDGVLQNRQRPPQFDVATQLIARYDYEANGHYIVSGFGVTFLERRQADGQLVCQVKTGVANVCGYKVERVHDERLVLDWNPDLRRVLSEPTVFTPDANQRMRIHCNYTPLDQIVRVQGTRRKTATVVHGMYSGAPDTLPDATVVQVLEVKQGETTYQVGTDYTVSGNVINWAPSGEEPAPGSSYTVTYDYIAQVTPTDVDETGFTVEGLVSGTLVQVDYDWRMPRMDALAIDRQGTIQRIKGVSVERNPTPPAVPAELLRLCDLSLTWTAEAPVRVIASGVRTVPTAELEAMRSDIGRLFDLVAHDRLAADISIREPAAKKGVFTDTFRGDTQRDMGITQNAVAVDNTLMAPIAATVLGPYLTQQVTLAYTSRTVLEQTARTGGIKINAYDAALPAPANVTLTPSRDFWTEYQTNQLAAITETIVLGSGNRTMTSTRRSTEVVSRDEESIPTLRSIPVSVRAVGFGPNEAVQAMRFDGISLAVPQGLAANAQGVVQTQFTIPAGVPAGVKRFEIEGAGGSYGEATFEGRGTRIVTTTRERVTTTITRWWWDPLAQTFVLPESQQVHAVDLWFTTKGTKPVTVQIRETSAGVPIRSVLAEGRLNNSQIQTAGATRIAFDTPAWLQAGVEYALVVLTDDTDMALSMAEIGKWDAAAGRWVTSQPYQVGVLLSSSNASTWTAHQDRDLTFRLLGVATTQAQHSVSLVDGAPVTDVTDIMVLGLTETPVTGTTVTARLTLGDGRVFSAPVGTTVQLPARYTGTLSVALDLRGTNTATPVVHPDWLVVVGTLADTANYVSRAIPAATSFSARVIADVYAPGTATVTLSVESGQAGQYQALTLQKAEPIGDGWVEMEWQASNLMGVGTDKLTRVKIDIENSPAYRARVRNLRAVIT